VPDDKGDVENCAGLGEELNMFRDKATARLRRNRAVTLIEAVLYISIALALIVGGLVFFQQASTAAKTSATVRQLSATLAEGRILLKGTPVSAVSPEITSYFIAAGAVPQDMVKSPTELTNAFGGTTRLFQYISAGRHLIVIEITNVPQGVCTRLLTGHSGTTWIMWTPSHGGTTLVSSGYAQGGAGLPGEANEKVWLLTATHAGWMCKYGGSNYIWQNTQPSTPPISGNVTVTMAFFVDP
jgi:hypothetical protein